MIEDSVLPQVRRGGFARIRLRDGPVVEGYAASDVEDARFVRLDSLAAGEDARLRKFSLRLSPDDMEAVEALEAAPRFQDADGSIVIMPASFWAD